MSQECKVFDSCKFLSALRHCILSEGLCLANCYMSYKNNSILLDIRIAKNLERNDFTLNKFTLIFV